MRDVVFVVRLGVARAELQYALRSLNFLPHNKVWMVGGNPDWVVNVEHVPFAHPEKWMALTKVWHLIASLPLTDEFVYTEDDYFITAPVDDIPNYHCGLLKNKVDSTRKYRGRRIPPGWQPSLYATHKVLTANGIEEPLSFDVHIPMVVEKDRIPIEWDPGDWPLRYRDLVGNTATRNPVKVSMDVKCSTLNKVKKVREANVGFLSSSDGTFVKSGVEPFLRELMPDPCRYEKEYYMDTTPVDEPQPSYERSNSAAARKARIVERRVPRQGPVKVKLDTGQWVDEAELGEEE